MKRNNRNSILLSIALLTLLFVGLVAVPAPALAENQGDDTDDPWPCVKTYTDPPGVVIDPWCLLPPDVPPGGPP